MNFLAFWVALSVVVVSVCAQPTETNAQRMARGLPPMSPFRRATGLQAARRSSPSSTPGSCNTGAIQCCNSVQTSTLSQVTDILTHFGLVVPVGVPIGLGCSPLTVIGAGGNSCSSQPVCCDHNDVNSAISIGCSPSESINLGKEDPP
ncbi:hypothetical protein CPB83DRAFT_761920 [Crepidotus variabilis]|uniref:Hydrophobin n=1 Tax=Crepidotus variabilis TaxID=179855 RepID=A0A9P6EJW3_9AGAR|nr:hypothetical protein CPB83DRAFT_761920 [Crepidotus variabilis]